MFNNGETRRMGFYQTLFQVEGGQEGPGISATRFQGIQQRSGYITRRSPGITFGPKIPGRMVKPVEVPYEIDPDILYKNSDPLNEPGTPLLR